MKLPLKVFFITMFFTSIIFSQNSKEKDEIERAGLEKVLGIVDRAGGTHNASNIGLFFENRGKLYPRRITQGPSGEFPINSTKHYIYRINPYVGIPGNVIQARYTNNEEWEAAAGYNNKDTARIAFSDDPNSWNPEKGWHAKDANGDPLFISDQDSYAVYNDSNSTNGIIGLEVIQTGYAFGVKFVKNIIFFKFQIVNKSSGTLNGLYFNLYTDCDVGNVSGGDPEYLDDRIGFDKTKNLLYFYDDGISNEWPDGKTGFMGVKFLKTPEINGTEAGITDMHYVIYDDDEIADKDTILYGIMSSSKSLYNSPIGSKYFHTGSSPNLHYDDPAAIPPSGLDLCAHISSGPYTLNRGDTLTFVTAIVAGETLDELLDAAAQAQNTADVNFQLPKPPPRPKLSGNAGNNKAVLIWDSDAENSLDGFSGEYDFEGYRIYRSIDKGLNWTKLAEFDLVNSIGSNTGLQYSYTDTTIINGFEYWYSITAYDRGSGTLESLESALGNTLDAPNIVSVIPHSSALGRNPVSSSNVEYTGTGKSNYLLLVDPVDNDSLGGNVYDIFFSFLPKKENGDLATQVSVVVNDSAKTKPYKYEIEFTSSSAFNVTNLSTGEVIRTGYPYPYGGRNLALSTEGITLKLVDPEGTTSSLRPEQGDRITVNFSVNAVKNKVDSLVHSRPFEIGQRQSIPIGVIFKMTPPDLIKSISRIGGSDIVQISFEVVDTNLVQNNFYLINIEGNGIDSENRKFVSLTVKDTGLILAVDTLYSSGTFTFDGIKGKIIFSENQPPSAGNKFSLETVKPVLPNLMDKYKFKIEGSTVDHSAITQNINRVRVVPNPYLASSLYEPEFGELRREPLRQIQFINLPQECTIHIFTVDADLVKTLHHNSRSGTEVWDLRTESGREIASGMYIYVLKSQDAEFIERFAVIK
ncbi:MAG: hypothetical protein HYS25_10785 [Ignavibacteriales bacterium]|nr:hypothetical protein [Ignavibacteriales bacterium]